MSTFKPIYTLRKFFLSDPADARFRYFIIELSEHFDDIDYLVEQLNNITPFMKYNHCGWCYLCNNPNAVNWVEQQLLNHTGKVCWSSLSANPAAIHLLEKHIHKIHWRLLSKNPAAIPLLEKHLDKVNWDVLSGNPNAIHLLEKNLDKVCWVRLSQNPNAIHLLEKHLDKVNWTMLSLNPNAIHLLERNLDKVS